MKILICIFFWSIITILMERIRREVLNKSLFDLTSQRRPVRTTGCDRFVRTGQLKNIYSGNFAQLTYGNWNTYGHV